MAERPFDERALRSAIVQVWGEYGAHVLVFDLMQQEIKRLQNIVDERWPSGGDDDGNGAGQPLAMRNFEKMLRLIPQDGTPVSFAFRDGKIVYRPRYSREWLDPQFESGES